MTAYLDIAPLITALRRRPAEFAWAGDWLRHIPSDHGFRFDATGRVTIAADCACALLSISQDQGRELYGAAEDFTRNYWRPKVINQHFASHFKEQTIVARVLAWMFGDHDDRVELGMELPEDRIRREAEVIELPAAPAPAAAEAPAEERLAA